MTLESEDAQRTLDDAFLRFKESYTEVTETIETIKLSLCESTPAPSAPQRQSSTQEPRSIAFLKNLAHF